MKIENPFSTIVSMIEELTNKVDELVKSSNSDPSYENEWMTIDDVIAYLPDKPKKSTIYQRCHNNKMPFVKIGGKSMFYKKDIDAWLQSNRRDIYYNNK